MKRLDVEPTQETLLEVMKSDRARRNDDIKDFVRLLDKTEGPYAYMIDSAWGAGKTFFVKSVELVLRAMNPKLTLVDTCPEPLPDFAKELEGVSSVFVPYYFNAWENDFAHDPLSALLANMAIAFDREGILKDRDCKNALYALIDAALSVTPISGVGAAAKALTGSSLVSSFESLQKVRDRLNGLADTMAFEGKAKLVIFVDELDRCRPDFSVRLLEQTKSMFNNRKVIFVFSADSQQLAKAVGGMYGDGFDSARFLERFFDRKVLLTPVDGFLFAMGGGLHAETELYERMVRECADRDALTIREAYRLQQKIEGAMRESRKQVHQSNLSHFAYQAILPLLVFIERDDHQLFRSIVSGADFDGLYEYGSKYETFADAVGRCCPEVNSEALMDGAQVEDRRRTFVHDLCVVIFGNSSMGSERENARMRLGRSSYVDFPERVFKRLEFPDE